LSGPLSTKRGYHFVLTKTSVQTAVKVSVGTGFQCWLNPICEKSTRQFETTLLQNELTRLLHFETKLARIQQLSPIIPTMYERNPHSTSPTQQFCLS
jgi:hypothetical protein